MAPIRCAAKFDPFLSLDCAPMPSTLAQSKERKRSNFAIWQPCLLINSKRNNFRQHLMIHTGERPFVCKFCDRGAIQSKQFLARVLAWEITWVLHEIPFTEESSKLDKGPWDTKKITEQLLWFYVFTVIWLPWHWMHWRSAVVGLTTKLFSVGPAHITESKCNP